MGKRARNGMSVDYYAVLGVSSRASADEIDHAFRVGAKRLHSDLNPGANPAEFAAIVEAHDVLSDDARRREYDQTRAAVMHPARRANSRPMRMPKARRHGRWPVVVAALAIGALFVAQVWAGNARDATHVPLGYERADATRVSESGAAYLVFVTAAGQSLQVPDPSTANIDEVGSHVTVQYRPETPNAVEIVKRKNPLDRLQFELVGFLVLLPILYVVRRLWFGRAAASGLHNHWYADLDTE